MSLLVPAAVAVGWLALHGYFHNPRDSEVSLIVPYEDVVSLAIASRRPPTVVLRALAQTGGLSGLLVEEQTIHDLVRLGQCSVMSPSAVPSLIPEGIDREYVLPLSFTSEQTSRQVCEILEARRPGIILAHQSYTGSLGIPCHVVALNAPRSLVNRIGLGLDDRILQAANLFGLSAIVKSRRYPGSPPRTMESIIRSWPLAGIAGVLCDDRGIPGYPGRIVQTADALANSNLTYGMMEFRRLPGEKQLARRLIQLGRSRGDLLRVVRVHTASTNEAERLEPRLLVARYVRAVRERHVRWCLVQLLTDGHQSPLRTNAVLIRNMASALRSFGYTIGHAPPCERERAPSWLLYLATLSVGAVSWFVLRALGLSVISLAALATAGGLSATWGLWYRPIIARQAAALAGACVFPILAMQVASSHPFPARSSVWRGLWRFASAVGVSLLGGLIVYVLLCDAEFVLRVHQFRGVKVAYLLPPMGVALLYARRYLRTHRAAPHELPRFTWADAALLALVAALLYVWLARHHEPDTGLVITELRLRAWLDQALFARPRLKEALIGFPALIVLAAGATKTWSRTQFGCILAATLGQASVVNSFCHIHTPLLISCIRILHSLWIGGLLGIVAVGVARRLRNRTTSAIDPKLGAADHEAS